MSTTIAPLYCSIRDACTRWGISRNYVYELLGAGEIKAIKLGVRTRIEVASIEAYFASLPKADIKPRASSKKKSADIATTA
jgi:excisionase family DNA binding protein